MENEIDKKIEDEIANALKPLEASPPSRRPFMAMVDVPQLPPADPLPEPPQAQEEPILTLTERLAMLDAQNAETRVLIVERCDELERMISERIATIEGLVEHYMNTVQAKIDAILGKLG